MRAYEVMTRAVATVTPQTPIIQVARMMRDMNIGDVLVAEDGKLRGIVTDRDLTLQVLTNGANTQAPVEPYMTTNVVTGHPDWSLEQIADVMGKHQIRRLPIVQDGNIVGIVSLGDVALHTRKRETVAESLKNISETTRTRFREASPLTKAIGIAVPFALAGAVIVFSRTKSGERVRKQIEASGLPDKAISALNDTLHSLQDARTRQAALEALEATGLPDKAREVVQDGIHTIQDPKTRKRALKLAEETRREAQHLPQQVARLWKPKPKRFFFA